MELVFLQSPLSQAQVDSIWHTLTIEQQKWINEYTNQQKRDKWFEALATRKGIVLDEGMSDEEKRNSVDDWELMEILDGGKGNKPFKCECGKSLRFQYTVYHPSKNKTYHLGSTCIEHYTGLQADVVRDIKKGILQINTKRDEILLKIQANQSTNLDRFRKKGVVIPEAISMQVEIGIPLLDNQIIYLQQKLEEIEWQQWHDEREKQQEQYRQRIREQSIGIKNNRQTNVETTNTRKGFAEINNQQREDLSYTYESFIDENLYILKQIREKEELLAPKLREEWEWMQEEVRRFKQEGIMDLDTFLIRMNNMMVPLRITR